MSLPLGYADELAGKAEVHEQIELLRSQLLEREQLVDALTERLEQAAEQLDRTRRLGAENGSQVNFGGGIPPDLIEEQKSLIEQLGITVNQWQDQLTLTVNQWQEVQAGAAIGRIEAQLAELKELLSGSSAPVESEHYASPGGQEASSSLADVLNKFGYRGEPEPEPVEPLQSARYQAYGRETAIEEEQAPESPESQEDQFSSDDEAIDSEPCEPLETRQLSNAPEPLDVEAASPDELREAVLGRDRYIAEMTRYVRALQAVDVSVIDMPDASELPAAHRRYLESWESRLHQQLRNAEVELSLERAKLAREEIALRQRADQASRDRKRHGDELAQLRGVVAENAENSASRDTPRSSWFGFLGRGTGKKDASRNGRMDNDDDDEEE